MKNFTLYILPCYIFLLANFYSLQASDKKCSDAMIVNDTKATQYVQTSFTIHIDKNFLATDSETLTIAPQDNIQLPAGTDCIILHRAFKATKGSLFVIKEVNETTNEKSLNSGARPRYTILTGKRK